MLGSISYNVLRVAGNGCILQNTFIKQPFIVWSISYATVNSYLPIVGLSLLVPHWNELLFFSWNSVEWNSCLQNYTDSESWL